MINVPRGFNKYLKVPFCCNSLYPGVAEDSGHTLYLKVGFDLHISMKVIILILKIKSFNQLRDINKEMLNNQVHFCISGTCVQIEGF